MSVCVSVCVCVCVCVLKHRIRQEIHISAFVVAITWLSRTEYSFDSHTDSAWKINKYVPAKQKELAAQSF